MCYKLIFLYLTVLKVFAAPPVNVVPTGNIQSVIPILSQSEEYDPNGTYRFSYETGNGIKREEAAYDKIIPKQSARRHDSDEGGEDSNSNESDEIHVQQGSYSYTAPDGTIITVKYIADENGFRPIIIQHSRKSEGTDLTSSISEKTGRQLQISSVYAPVIPQSNPTKPIPQIEGRNFGNPSAPEAASNVISPEQTSSSLLSATSENLNTASEKSTEGVSSTLTKVASAPLETSPPGQVSSSEIPSTVLVDNSPKTLAPTETSSTTVVAPNSAAIEVSAPVKHELTQSTVEIKPSTTSAPSSVSSDKPSSATTVSLKNVPEEPTTTGIIAESTAKASITEQSASTASESISTPGESLKSTSEESVTTGLPSSVTTVSTTSKASEVSTTTSEAITESQSTLAVESATTSSTSTTPSEESSTIGQRETNPPEEPSTTGVPSTTTAEEPSTKSSEATKTNSEASITTEAHSTTVSEEASTTVEPSTTVSEESSTAGAQVTTASEESIKTTVTATTSSDESTTTEKPSTTEAESSTTTETGSKTTSEPISTTEAPSTTESKITGIHDVTTTEETKTTSS